MGRVEMTGPAASHAALWRMPRKRPPPAWTWASSTGATPSPSLRSTVPTMPAATRQDPYAPEALMAAMPLTNSVSPTGRMASGPVALCMAVHCTNTVDTTLWPLLRSARSSSSR